MALTRRTVLRKAFLAPWDPLVQQVFLYALADAQAATGVDIHHAVTCVSHYHAIVTPSRANLPEFTRRFHVDVSKGLHELLCRERYDAPHELFDDRQTHWMRLMDPEAQAGQLVYDHLNPSTAGLVDRPENWPGVLTDFGLWRAGATPVERPDLAYFARRDPVRELVLTPPPELYAAFAGDTAGLVHHLNRLVEHGVRELRRVRKRPVLGARRCRRLHPWDEPRTLREGRQHRVPSFKYGASGWDGRRRRIQGALEVRAFRKQHRKTRQARRDGDDPEAVYPFGTYAAVAYRNEPVEAEPLPDAQVCRPGRCFADVVAEHRGEVSEVDESPSARLAILDAVRSTLTDEAEGALLIETLDFERPRRPDVAGEEPVSIQAPIVRHRFGSRQGLEAAPRVVRLRDRRRGRPSAPESDPRRTGGDSDPPG
jgi:putative transposase